MIKNISISLFLIFSLFINILNAGKGTWEERTKDREMILNYVEYKEELMFRYPDKEYCEIIFIIIKKYISNELKFNYEDRGIYNSDKDYCTKHNSVKDLKRKDQEYDEKQKKK